jgi:putative phosphoribosyl transferase
MLGKLVDEVICLGTPENFGGVGRFYSDFHQLSDAEVVDLLAEHAARAAVSPGDAQDGPVEK